MREEAEGLVQEAVVVVVAAVHGARALPGLPEGVLLLGHRVQLGEDVLARAAVLGQRAVDGEPVGVGEVAHRTPSCSRSPAFARASRIARWYFGSGSRCTKSAPSSSRAASTPRDGV